MDKGQGTIHIAAIDITGGCNMNCLHCYNSSGENTEADCSVFALKKVIDEAALMGIIDICFCGGEPLLVYDKLMELLSYSAGRFRNMNLVTNGYLLTDDMAKELQKAGIGTVQVSLDGAYVWQHDSLRGTDAAYDKAVEAIRMFVKAGIPAVIVSMLPDKLSISSVYELCTLCCSLGVRIVRCMPYLPMGRGAGPGKMLIPDDEEMFRFQRELLRAKRDMAGKMEVLWMDPVEEGRQTAESILNGSLPAGLFIRSNGEVTTDPYNDTVIGNIKEDSLMSIVGSIRPESLSRAVNIHNVYEL